MITDNYLLVYNLLSSFGWLLVLSLSLSHLLHTPNPLPTYYSTIKLPLLISQSLAVLEIFHAAFGFVRSPVITVTVQVMSRIMILWGFTYWNEAAQINWSVIMMTVSWTLVEVVRYPFYALSLGNKILNDKKWDAEGEGNEEKKVDVDLVPYWLFYLRYSVFLVLYPTGITGEVLQVWNSLPMYRKYNPMLARLAHVFLVLYVPFAPFMIFNMISVRRAAFKKRKLEKLAKAQVGKDAAAAGVKTVSGLVFPITNWSTFERSTTITNKYIWQKSIEAVNQTYADMVESTRNWRFGYTKHVVANVRLCLKSKENALKIAEEGLKAVRERFVFNRDGKQKTLEAAMSNITGSFHTGYIKGEKPKLSAEELKLGIPYKGKTLYGEEAKKQLDTWVNNGTIEPSARDAISNVIDNPKWQDLSDSYFVLLGATSAMGPLYELLKLGANIVAVDIDREHVWRKLLDAVKNSSGSVIFPLSKPQEEIPDYEDLAKYAGANLLEKTPEIANWLWQCDRIKNRDITMGNYTYLDGALHVQLAVACDLIMEKVSRMREVSSSGCKTNLAFLCTPTDVHPIPKEAHDASLVNYRNAPLWQKLLSRFSNQLEKNARTPVVDVDGVEHYFVDGIVGAQGPNYALAKRIQHWRCVIAQQRFNQTVSSNVAPSTSTKSVVSNSQFAAAYYGFRLFAAMEVMDQETSSAVMLALLVNDLRNPKSVSNPDVAKKLANPFELFKLNSFHGGVWRTPFKIDSIGVTAALYYYLNTYKIVVVTIVAVAVGTVNYVVKGSPV